MTTLLHVALYLVVAAASWLSLLLAIATVIHGRAWVGVRMRAPWRQRARDRSHDHPERW
jgi:hypothetical protein